MQPVTILASNTTAAAPASYWTAYPNAAINSTAHIDPNTPPPPCIPSTRTHHTTYRRQRRPSLQHKSSRPTRHIKSSILFWTKVRASDTESPSSTAKSPDSKKRCSGSLARKTILSSSSIRSVRALRLGRWRIMWAGQLRWARRMDWARELGWVLGCGFVVRSALPSVCARTSLVALSGAERSNGGIKEGWNGPRSFWEIMVKYMRNHGNI